MAIPYMGGKGKSLRLFFIDFNSNMVVGIKERPFKNED